MAEKILRVYEVSERIGLSVSTVQRLVRDGAMPSPVRLAKRAVGWHESVIDTWLKDRPAATKAKSKAA